MQLDMLKKTIIIISLMIEIKNDVLLNMKTKMHLPIKRKKKITLIHFGFFVFLSRSVVLYQRKKKPENDCNIV